LKSADHILKDVKKVELNRPRVIVCTAGKTKEMSRVFSALIKHDLRITRVKSVASLSKKFDEDSFDLLILYLNKDMESFLQFVDEYHTQLDATLICSVGPHAQYTIKDIDFHITKDLLEQEHLLEIFFDGIVRRSQREKNKSELSAMVIHDLRSPLQSILGYLELLQNNIFGEMNEGQHQILANALSLGDVTVSLLEELSQVYQYESRDFRIQKSHVSVKDFLDDILRALWIQADKKNIKFIPQVASNLPDVYADKLAIQRVLMNLLTNAINFSPDNGMVRIEVYESVSAGQKSQVKFQIVDSGPGIPSDQIETVFDKYNRLKEKRAGRKKGFGLGLYVAKLIVEAHKGQIGIYNNREGGSTF
jgi:signal transduction histidine kinase